MLHVHVSTLNELSSLVFSTLRLGSQDRQERKGRREREGKVWISTTFFFPLPLLDRKARRATLEKVYAQPRKPNDQTDTSLKVYISSCPLSRLLVLRALPVCAVTRVTQDRKDLRVSREFPEFTPHFRRKSTTLFSLLTARENLTVFSIRLEALENKVIPVQRVTGDHRVSLVFLENLMKVQWPRVLMFHV